MHEPCTSYEPCSPHEQPVSRRPVRLATTARSIRWNLAVAAVLLAAPVWAGDVVLHDAAADPAVGLDYERTRSAIDSIYQGFVSAGVMTGADLFDVPSKWRGAPGVAILDFDRDGDLDLYVANGPGTANSLFSNQLRETGSLSFFDVASSAGVAATTQDSSGICFGDTDNDGDPDLLVLSDFGPNLFFENLGNGTFQDLSIASGLGVDDRDSTSCSFGDVDGDGLLDVVIGNTFDWSSNIAIGLEPFAANDHNQLFHNQGANTFIDVSVASGLTATAGFSPPGFEGSPTISWAIAMVDYDQDGDIDIVQADDQAGVPEAPIGVDRGLLHLFENDGSGSFTDVTALRQTNRAGCWMGLSFSDLNRDGTLDIFGTNCGAYGRTLFTDVNPVYGAFGPFGLGDRASRWLLQQSDGTFTDPGVGSLVAVPFGWGTSMADYDNDGDTDIVYYGDLAFGPLVSHENPGTVLENDGNANFDRDATALAGSADHSRRHVQGVAIGDLDDNGFPDLVTASSHDVQPAIPLTPVGFAHGSPFDDSAFYQANFLPTAVFGVWTYAGLPDNVDGSLAVEISSGNSNRWVKVRTLGTVGLTSDGRVNRDGIGAVVSVRPRRGETAMQPVLGGSSYSSQDSLEIGFGLGSKRRGRVEVLWPGGVRNRLYGVRHRERLLFPEIPVSFDDPSLSFPAYLSKVSVALDELEAAGVLNHIQSFRFFLSAALAFLEEQA